MSNFRSPSYTVRIIIAAIAIGALAVSCGGDDDDDAATAATTTTASACADREALSASVDDLKNVDLVAEGTNGANAAIAAVEEDLTALQSSASAELQPQVEAVQDSIDELKTAVESLDSGGASAAVAAVSDVASSASTLLASLESC